MCDHCEAFEPLISYLMPDFDEEDFDEQTYGLSLPFYQERPPLIRLFECILASKPEEIECVWFRWHRAEGRGYEGGDSVGAIEDWTWVIEESGFGGKDLEMPYVLRGLLYSALDQYEEAATDLAYECIGESMRAKTAQARGEANFKLGRYADAVPDLKEAGMGAWGGRALQMLGETYNALRDHECAEKAYGEAIRRMEGITMPPLDNLFGEPVSAPKQLYGRDYVDCYLGRAKARQALGRHDVALEDIAQVVVLSADMDTAAFEILELVRIEHLVRQTGQYANALDFLASVTHGEPPQWLKEYIQLYQEAMGPAQDAEAEEVVGSLEEWVQETSSAGQREERRHHYKAVMAELFDLVDAVDELERRRRGRALFTRDKRFEEIRETLPDMIAHEEPLFRAYISDLYQVFYEGTGKQHSPLLTVHGNSDMERHLYDIYTLRQWHEHSPFLDRKGQPKDEATLRRDTEQVAQCFGRLCQREQPLTEDDYMVTQIKLAGNLVALLTAVRDEVERQLKRDS